MKKFKLYKSNNFVRAKALLACLMLLLSCTSCSKGKNSNYTNITTNITTNVTTTQKTTPTTSTIIKEEPINTKYNYNLNNYVFIDNQFSILNTEFQPSDETYNRLMNDINSYGYDTSFIALSLNDGMSFGYNVDSEYWSASTIKCAYALYVCKLIDEGKASFDDVLTVTSKFNSAGSGKIQKMPRGTKLTLKEVLHYTLHVSDNQGYHMLVDRFKKDEFNSMLESIGCEDMALPTTKRFGDVNCRSFALVWQEILNYCKEETETSKFLYDTLLNAEYNYIKNGITDKLSLHKSGWNQGRVCHDTGVVLDEENPYIIIILTENNGKKQIIKMAQDIDAIMEEYTLYLNESKKNNNNKVLVYKKK